MNDFYDLILIGYEIFIGLLLIASVSWAFYLLSS